MENKSTGWVLFDGSDEQIAEISSAKHGFVCRNNESDSGILTIKYGQLFSDKSEYPILNAMWNGSLKRFVETHNTTHYWIISDYPLRDMKIRQAQTGQPVWVRYKKDLMVLRPGDKAWRKEIIVTTTPDWNIPNAEYSFTEFKEEV